MNRYKNHIKCTFIIMVVFFLMACLTTNVPDEASILYGSDSIISYQNETGWSYHFLKRQIIPEQALQVSFNYSMYWEYENSSILDILGRLYITKPYRQLHIKEISYVYNGNKIDLINNETFFIDNIGKENMLFDENDEPIIINGENYYWTSVDFNKKIRRIIRNGHRGEEKIIELVQIYSFDDEETRYEIINYKIISGGKKFDPKRLIIWMYPP